MTQQSEQATVWLTQDAYDKLTTELEDLKGPRRQEIVGADQRGPRRGRPQGERRLPRRPRGAGQARGPDPQLEDMLRRAEVGETPSDDGIVDPGMKVTYKFVGDDDEDAETFLLGAREMEDVVEGVKVYSPQSAARHRGHRRHQGREGELRGSQRQGARGRRSSTWSRSPAEPSYSWIR